MLRGDCRSRGGGRRLPLTMQEVMVAWTQVEVVRRGQILNIFLK